jgi:hypothetical protein
VGWAIDVDDGVNRVGPLFGIMDLKVDGGCLWDADGVDVSDVQIWVVVHRHVTSVSVLIARELIAVRVDVVVEHVFSECDDIWRAGELFDMFGEE